MKERSKKNSKAKVCEELGDVIKINITTYMLLIASIAFEMYQILTFKIL